MHLFSDSAAVVEGGEISGEELQGARSHLISELRTIASSDLRRCTADLLCLLETSARIDDRARRAEVNRWDERALAPQSAAFVRSRLAVESAEAPRGVQAALWIDLQRQCLELRSNLLRVTSALRDLGLYGGELGFGDDSLLDCTTRELVLNGHRTSLTKLEFGVMEYLHRNRGQIVSRAALLQNVWEQSFYGGSNVVDVVVRALRKKLRDCASVIETVRGVGYLLRRAQMRSL
jgi:hypothetical protein